MFFLVCKPFEEKVGGSNPLKTLQPYANKLEKKYCSKAFKHFRNANMKVLLEK